MNDRQNKRRIDEISEGSEAKSADALATTSMPKSNQANIANQTNPLNFHDLTFSNDEINSFLALPPIDTQLETTAIKPSVEDTATNLELEDFSTKSNFLQSNFGKLTDNVTDPLYTPCIPFLRLKSRETLSITINLIEFLVARRQSYLALDIWRNNSEVRAFFAGQTNQLKNMLNSSRIANFFVNVLYPESKEIADYIWHARPELGDFFREKNDTLVFFKILGIGFIDLIKIILNNNATLKAKLNSELYDFDGTFKFMYLVRSTIHRDCPGFMQELIGAINDPGKLYNLGIEVLNTRNSLLTNSEQEEIYRLLETRRKILIAEKRNVTSQPQNTNQANRVNTTNPTSSKRSQSTSSSQGLTFNEATFQNMIRNTTLLRPSAKQNTKKGRAISNTQSPSKKR